MVGVDNSLADLITQRVPTRINAELKHQNATRYGRRGGEVFRDLAKRYAFGLFQRQLEELTTGLGDWG